MSGICYSCNMHDYFMLHGFPTTDYFILILHRLAHLRALLQEMDQDDGEGGDQGLAAEGGAGEPLYYHLYHNLDF